MRKNTKFERNIFYNMIGRTLYNFGNNFSVNNNENFLYISFLRRAKYKWFYERKLNEI